MSAPCKDHFQVMHQGQYSCMAPDAAVIPRADLQDVAERPRSPWPLVLVIDFRANAPVPDTLKPDCWLLRVYCLASGVLSTVIQLETQKCD